METVYYVNNHLATSEDYSIYRTFGKGIAQILSRSGLVKSLHKGSGNMATTVTQLESTLPQKRSLAIVRPNKNVLVVEDDADTGTMVCHVLIREGYGARLVPSREEALQVLNTYLYDYILLDFSMPGMAARDFVTRVKATRPGCQIILMTAAGCVQALAKDLNLPCFLPKPFEPYDVLSTIQSIEERNH
jgi:CheY-like chemotaxis protein